MATVVVARELLVTGLRGMVEATGAKFGADWFGKLKMVLQSAAVAGVLVLQTLRIRPAPSPPWK
jgi:CDP-diacylglycerol--glycerol-3-phosphate 3-phosphatidyltransferase